VTAVKSKNFVSLALYFIELFCNCSGPDKKDYKKIFAPRRKGRKEKQIVCSLKNFARFAALRETDLSSYEF